MSRLERITNVTMAFTPHDGVFHDDGSDDDATIGLFEDDGSDGDCTGDLFKDDGSDDDDDGVVYSTTSTLVDQKSPKRRSYPKIRQRRRSQKQNTNPQQKTTAPTCDPSTPSIIETIDRTASRRWLHPIKTWHDEQCIHVEHILRACDRLMAAARTEDETCQLKSVVRNTMAMQDRFLVEVQAISTVAKEEVRHSYKRTCDLVEHLRSCEDRASNDSTVSRAMDDVTQVKNLLRGLHPHTSYAHAHPNVPLKVDVDSSDRGITSI